MRGARLSYPGLAAAAIAGAVAVLYLMLIAQGTVGYEGHEVYVAVVALILFAQAGLAAAGAVRRSVTLLAGTGALLLATGVLALFSIGWPLLVAGLLAWAAAGWEWVRRPR